MVYLERTFTRKTVTVRYGFHALRVFSLQWRPQSSSEVGSRYRIRLKVSQILAINPPSTLITLPLT